MMRSDFTFSRKSKGKKGNFDCFAENVSKFIASMSTSKL